MKGEGQSGSGEGLRVRGQLKGQVKGEGCVHVCMCVCVGGVSRVRGQVKG